MAKQAEEGSCSRASVTKADLDRRCNQVYQISSVTIHFEPLSREALLINSVGFPVATKSNSCKWPPLSFNGSPTRCKDGPTHQSRLPLMLIWFLLTTLKDQVGPAQSSPPLPPEVRKGIRGEDDDHDTRIQAAADDDIYINKQGLLNSTDKVCLFFFCVILSYLININ